MNRMLSLKNCLKIFFTWMISFSISLLLLLIIFPLPFLASKYLDQFSSKVISVIALIGFFLSIVYLLKIFFYGALKKQYKGFKLKLLSNKESWSLFLVYAFIYFSMEIAIIPLEIIIEYLLGGSFDTFFSEVSKMSQSSIGIITSIILEFFAGTLSVKIFLNFLNKYKNSIVIT